MVCVLGCTEQSSAQLAVLETKSKDPPESRVLQGWNLRVWLEAASAGILRSSWRPGCSSGLDGELLPLELLPHELLLFPSKAAP